MRWSFGFENPNYAATLLSMGCCLGMALTIAEQMLWKKLLGCLFILVVEFLLTATGSRGGAASAIIACLVMAILSDDTKVWRCGALILLGASQLIAGIFLSMERFKLPSLESGLGERLQVWLGACQLSWEAGFNGVGEYGFGSAYNLWHEVRETNRIWTVALGDPQTLCVANGWWASGLWVGASGLFLGIGRLALKRGCLFRGLALIGCAITWLSATAVSDHCSASSVLLPALGVLSALAVWSISWQKIQWKKIALAVSIGFSVGAFVPPLIGLQADIRQHLSVRLLRDHGFSWWESTSCKFNSPRVFISAPPNCPGVGTFVRKMTNEGYSISILDSPRTPLAASLWMAEKTSKSVNILLGVGPFAASSIKAALSTAECVRVITWGGPLENPILLEKSLIAPHTLKGWWAFWNSDADKAAASPYFNRISDKDSLWIEVSGCAIGEWKSGDAIAEQLIYKYPFLRSGN